MFTFVLPMVIALSEFVVSAAGTLKQSILSARLSSSDCFSVWQARGAKGDITNSEMAVNLLLSCAGPVQPVLACLVTDTPRGCSPSCSLLHVWSKKSQHA